MILKTKILVVDDELAIQDLLYLVLTRDGYEVTVVPDGKTALTRVESFQPDLVVLDLMLPDMSGHEICRRITDVRRTPIIMLTAKDDVVDKVLGLELGADDYVTKPFDTRELLARIKSLLRRLSAKGGSPEELRICHLDLEIDL